MNCFDISLSIFVSMHSRPPKLLHFSDGSQLQTENGSTELVPRFDAIR